MQCCNLSTSVRLRLSEEKIMQLRLQPRLLNKQQTRKIPAQFAAPAQAKLCPVRLRNAGLCTIYNSNNLQVMHIARAFYVINYRFSVINRCTIANTLN
jgi:hypothetical protein